MGKWKRRRGTTIVGIISGDKGETKREEGRLTQLLLPLLRWLCHHNVSRKWGLFSFFLQVPLSSPRHPRIPLPPFPFPAAIAAKSPSVPSSHQTGDPLLSPRREREGGRRGAFFRLFSLSPRPNSRSHRQAKIPLLVSRDSSAQESGGNKTAAAFPPESRQ